MAGFGEPFDWTQQRQQDAVQYFPTLDYVEPDDNMEVDMSMLESGEVPSAFSQSAMSLASFGAQTRAPQQQEQSQGGGFLSGLFNLISEIDKPISQRLGFKAEGQGALSSIENIAMEEATRPSNILLAAGGLLTGGLSTSAAGARIAAGAAARAATRNIITGVGARVAAEGAGEALDYLGVENPLARQAAQFGAGFAGGGITGLGMSGLNAWRNAAKAGMLSANESIDAAARASLAAQQARQAAAEAKYPLTRWGYLMGGGERFGPEDILGGINRSELPNFSELPEVMRPAATRTFPSNVVGGRVVPPAGGAGGAIPPTGGIGGAAAAGAGGGMGGGVPPAPPTPPPPSNMPGPAGQAAQAIAANAWSNASLGEKINAFLSIPMFLKSNYDLSAVGRQLAPVIAAHPKMIVPVMKAQFESLGSEAGYLAHQASILNDPMKILHDFMGIEYNDLTKNRAQQLGSYLTSNLLGWMPGSQAFERAYTSAINESRRTLANKLIEEFISSNSLGGGEELKRIGALVNAATGQGKLPAFLGESKFLGQQLFWAPRLLAGRLKVPYEAIFGEGIARKEAAKQMLSFVGINSALLATAAKLGVADVELNPRSSDFGQFVIDGRRYDPWAGYRPIANLVARFGANVATGAGQSLGYEVDIPAMKGIKTAEGEAGTYNADSLDIITKFLRNKMAPIPAEVLTQLTGKDVTGERVDTSPGGKAGHAAIALLAPLFLEQLVQESIYKYGEGGPGEILKAAAANVPYAFGVGGQYYIPRPGEMAAMGKYDQLDPEQKLDAIRSMSWQRVKDVAGSDAKSFASWQQAAKKEYVKYFIENGVDPIIADKRAQSMIDRSPVSKMFDRMSTYYENQWIQENPELARSIITKDMNLPYNQRRLSITKKQAKILSAVSPQE